MHHPTFGAEAPSTSSTARTSASTRRGCRPASRRWWRPTRTTPCACSPSQRRGAQRIYDATRFNALNGELIAGGNGVQGVAAGIPIPSSGLEVIWNHILRYRGDQIHFVTNQAAVLANGSYNLLKLDRNIYAVRP